MQKMAFFSLFTLFAFSLLSCSQGTGPEGGEPLSSGDDPQLSSDHPYSSAVWSSESVSTPYSSSSVLQSSSSQAVSSSSLNTALPDLLTKAQYHQIFPITNPASPHYRTMTEACAAQAKCRSVTTYEGFVEAASRFEGFLEVGTLNDRKRELAAFLANVEKETTGGWSGAPGGEEFWGLCFCEELGSPGGYTQSSDPNYQPVPGQGYHGRGALQISYPYNYGPASEYIYGDKNVLLQNPDKVLQDPIAFWGASIWFWTVKEDVAPGETPPGGNPSAMGFDGKYYKPSCHMAMTHTWVPRPSDQEKRRTFGLGVTINVINGGLECAAGWDARGQKRVKNYKKFAEILGVNPLPESWTGAEEEYYSCQNQVSFTTP